MINSGSSVDMKERPMINGGTEYTLEFAGVSKHVKGLGH